MIHHERLLVKVAKLVMTVFTTLMFVTVVMIGTFLNLILYSSVSVTVTVVLKMIGEVTIEMEGGEEGIAAAG